MRKSNSISFLFVCAVLTVLAACAKDVTDEGWADDAERTSKLTISTRDGGSGTGGNGVNYPVNVYVMNSSGTCVELLALESSETPLTFNLAKGSYTIYAVGDADGERYTLPTKANATAESVIQPKTGKTLDDLMMATATVTLGNNQTSNLTLEMARKVVYVKSVAIKQVPDDVDEVTVSIAPTYTGVCLNGTLTGTGGLHTISLTKPASGTTWTATPSYAFPSIGDNVTITVSFKVGTTVTSYISTIAKSMPVNYQINIDGTYTGGTVALSGTIQGAADYAGEDTFTFTFEQESGSGSGGGTTPSTPTTSVPEVGTLYQGCYVLAVNGKTATVLSSKQQNNLLSSGNDDAFSDAITAALGTWSVDGISSTWRLPTEVEAQLMINAKSSIENCMLTDAGCFYYFQHTTDVRGRFQANGNNEVSSNYTLQSAPDRSYLRPVTDITFD